MRNIFDTQADALVNPINCVGVMGAGLAKQFALKYPVMLDAYKMACDMKELQPGKIFVWQVDKVIFNFPTKDDWRNPSEYSFIESGMAELVTLCHRMKVRSIAIPALGCGLGGLDWGEVKKIILKHFEGSSIQLDLYDPN